MKRKLSFLVFVSFCVLYADKVHAQSPKVTLSPELLVPFSERFTVGLGGILEAEWPAERRLGITLASGVETLFREHDRARNYTFLPIKGGIKYYVDPKFFLNFNLGAAIGFNRYGTDLLIGGGAGYQFNNRIDAGFRVEGAATSYLALRVGFRL